MHKKQTVAFHTLGCKLNFSETSTIARMMEKEGYEKRDFTDLADVYVINTCSVTDNADKECRQLVRRIQRKAPDSFVVITGCYAQLKPKEIAAIQGVDLVLGAAEKFNIAKHISELTKTNNPAKICSCDIETLTGFNASFSQNDRTRTFLKVQDGCDYNCSFCTIPMARGKSRSDSIANVVKQCTSLAADGVKEIVLTGVNLGDFGKGADGDKSETDFTSLVKALDEVAGIQRYRISSIEPNLLTNELIEWVAKSDQFMPHFHIPLQSGSNDVLAAMRRRYRKELYAERVALIKKLMPHAAIGVDVIVGFPGETDAHFQETFDFLHALDIAYLHVFTYSERDSTKALEIKPIVPIQIRNERNKTLRNLSYMKLQYFTLQHSGDNRKVLFEAFNKEGMMEGYTDNYIRVTTPYRAEWANQLVDWNL
ncbi:MAG: tRNA (N(6)-L-threonylcarbamoyladenosine(37)-C(2))-methylthiotransferase MtaB [Sphingobacteriia bacterium]|nr:MAG: tRNA (N(6)-L-threonylcarbamoyladenosine(37)-C(2))-methylthiotransferase MtaB [Sphingobacteriia bacterium]TAH09204.1 MAG: tRNA (N(6)-L-threonylcarbamoyladenosine(37)-C(2))-methylthiotransferase MtaB [Sphingobacteriia bacterium]